MLVQSPVAGDSRVLREATALVAAGHAVHIVGRDVPADLTPPHGVTVESVGATRGLRPGSSRPARDPLPIRVARWMLLPEHRSRVERAWTRAAAKHVAKRLRADVIHAHDFNTLQLGAGLADRWDARLIYDAHELWFGRALPGRPTPAGRRRGAALERRLAARAQAVLVVSEAIANRMRASGLPNVRVVRNTFTLDTRTPDQPIRSPSGVVYAGRIGAGRDLETVRTAARRLVPFQTVLVGSLEPGYAVPAVDGLSVLPSTSLEGVDRIYRELGIAVVPLSDRCDNHRLALPNKLFHAVRAGVPVVAADLPAIRELMTEHHLGTLFRPGDPGSLVDAVHELVASYPRHLEAVRAARLDLNWAVDARVLVKAYEDLVQ